MNTCAHTKTCTWLFTSAFLFCNGQKLEKTKMSYNRMRLLNKPWHTHTTEYHSTTRREGASLRVATWMDFKGRGLLGVWRKWVNLAVPWRERMSLNRYQAIETECWFEEWWRTYQARLGNGKSSGILEVPITGKVGSLSLRSQACHYLLCPAWPDRLALAFPALSVFQPGQMASELHCRYLLR